ncbi:DUF177 domain-containing protein [Xylanibacillus composti]|uniref:Metal-binding protein n=1 Tax=Xylanibacillus composti TaxID=1572762 RepID=A0A8J4H0J2_9BACL|nr:YceD family protein [Xylanibacillus composti]MDT9724137.1 DUF177 domain-containing protein [Xylanibacillus composti]GIQ68687.1 metal-binding protein [Xylanibacillus composti]
MTWIIQMRDLLRVNKPVEIDAQLELKDASKMRQEILQVSPLQVKLQASGSQGIATVEGEGAAELEVQCSRCLDTYKSELRFPILERFRQPTSESEASEEDEDIHELESDQIDLRPYVEEAFWLALPFVYVCREDCQGLCQVCGTNRNERDCGCSQDRIDPRLAALQDFFKE